MPEALSTKTSSINIVSVFPQEAHITENGTWWTAVTFPDPHGIPVSDCFITRWEVCLWFLLVFWSMVLTGRQMERYSVTVLFFLRVEAMTWGRIHILWQQWNLCILCSHYVSGSVIFWHIYNPLKQVSIYLQPFLSGPNYVFHSFSCTFTWRIFRDKKVKVPNINLSTSIFNFIETIQSSWDSFRRCLTKHFKLVLQWCSVSKYIYSNDVLK